MIDYTYEAKVLFNERAYDEAFAFAEKADKSDKYIQYILGTCYRNGYGTEKNLDLAVDYFQKSARQRMEWACFRLGIMYYNAEGIARDYDKAFYWIKKAAARGHAEAQRCLAVCYRDGIGVEKNNEEADIWIREAARNGDAAAKKYVASLSVREGESAQVEHKYDVFISYRRNGGRDFARLLHEALEGRGLNCFFDYSSLRHGEFDNAIYKAIDEAANFLMLVTDGAYDRCHDETDWVRLETEYALLHKKNIVPICPSGHAKMFPDSLPGNLIQLNNIHISRMDMEDFFEESIDKIIKERLILRHENMENE